MQACQEAREEDTKREEETKREGEAKKFKQQHGNAKQQSGDGDDPMAKEDKDRAVSKHDADNNASKDDNYKQEATTTQYCLLTFAGGRQGRC